MIEESNHEIPKIEPLPVGTQRPLWSVMIPTYNCAAYLSQTLQSVLSQDLGADQMQIEVVDDCSTQDDPEAVVEEYGKGRVSFYRQEKNVGISKTFTTCVQRSRGYWVHILHGDDVVLPDFYKIYETFINSSPDVNLVFSKVAVIDEHAEWISISGPRLNTEIDQADHLLSVANFICAPSVVAKRAMYEKLGGFHTKLSHTADWEMWTRIASEGKIGYIREKPCLLYRQHFDSDTSTLVLTAKNIEETIQTSKILISRLPQKLQNEVYKKSKRIIASIANQHRAELQGQQKKIAAVRHAKWAVNLHPSPRNIIRLLISLYRAL
jgi:glycosyltransferase involved in cell wall biosynthesis